MAAADEEAPMVPVAPLAASAGWAEQSMESRGDRSPKTRAVQRSMSMRESRSAELAQHEQRTVSQGQLATFFEQRRGYVSAMVGIPGAVLMLAVYVAFLHATFTMDMLLQTQAGVGTVLGAGGGPMPTRPPPPPAPGAPPVPPAPASASTETVPTYDAVQGPDDVWQFIGGGLLELFWNLPAPKAYAGQGGMGPGKRRVLRQKAPAPAPRQAGATPRPAGATPRPAGAATPTPTPTSATPRPAGAATPRPAGSATPRPASATPRQAPNEAIPQMFPGRTAGGPRAGVAVSFKGSKNAVKAYQTFNRVIGGMLITQRRVAYDKTINCYDLKDGLKEHTEVIYQSVCHPDLKGNLQQACWDKSPRSVIPTCEYNASNVGSTNMKSVFTDEVVYFSLGDTIQDVAKLLSYLKSNDWIDEYTTQLTVSLVMYNGELGVYSAAAIDWRLSRGGNVAADGFVRSAAVPAQVDTAAGRRIYWLRTSYYTLVALTLLLEAVDLLKLVKNQGVFAIKAYLTDGWNYLDWAVIGSALFTHSRTLSYELELHDTLELLKNSRQITTNEYIRVILGLVDATDDSFTIRMAGGITVLLLVARIFKSLKLHPSLSFLTATLGAAAQQLVPFFLLFGVVAYAFLESGKLLFGANVPEFASYWLGTQAIFLMLLGEFDYAALTTVDPLAGMLWFWLFYIVLFYLMLNMLLAIIFDSYAEVKERAGRGTLISNYEASKHWMLYAWRPGTKSDENILKALGEFDAATEFDVAKLAEETGVSAEDAKRVFRVMDLHEDDDEVDPDQLMREQMGAMLKTMQRLEARVEELSAR